MLLLNLRITKEKSIHIGRICENSLAFSCNLTVRRDDLLREYMRGPAVYWSGSRNTINKYNQVHWNVQRSKDCSGRMAQLVGVSFHKPKGCGFDPWSRQVLEAIHWCFSLFLPSKINEHPWVRRKKRSKDYLRENMK